MKLRLISQCDFYIDKNEKNHVAVIINFEGRRGMVMLDGLVFVTGREKSEDGECLYITTSFFVLAPGDDDGGPDVSFVHRK